jgi:hypothetical protein
MIDDPRIEVVARAMARYRLGHSTLIGSLPTDLTREIFDNCVEKLWPTLLEEASAITRALGEMEVRSASEQLEAAPSAEVVPAESQKQVENSFGGELAKPSGRLAALGFDGL